MLLPLLSFWLACAARRPVHVPTPEDAAIVPGDDCAVFERARLDRTLTRRTESRAREGNAVELVPDHRSYDRRIAEAAQADVILIKTFIFTDDETGQAVAALLRARARAGALVIVQYDIKGSLGALGEQLDLLPDGDPFLRELPLMDEMRQDGVIVVPTNMPRGAREVERWDRADEAAQQERVGWLEWMFLVRDFAHFDHEKYWITGKRGADGALVYEAIMGGLNIASEYAYGGTERKDASTGRGGWRDTDVVVRGPVVEDIVRRYLDVLALNVEARPVGLDPAELEVAQPVAGSARVRFVWNQPRFGSRHHIEELYRTLIRATPDAGTVRLGTAYFTPSRELRDALEDHVEQGGRLAVVTNSAESTDMGVVHDASRGAYLRLLDHDPRAALYEWVPAPGWQTYHSKIASFGACGPVIVGSANLDGLSIDRNSESVLVIENAAFRAAFDAHYDADLSQSERLTSGDAARTPCLQRIRQRATLRFGWRYLSP